MPTINIPITASGDSYRHLDPNHIITTNLTDIGIFGGPVTVETGCRWTGITIPSNSIITNAYITVTGRYTDGTVVALIQGHDVDNAVAAPDDSTWHAIIDGGTQLTAASVPWNPPAFIFNTPYDTPDITTIIQEIIDRLGWASGNAIQLFILDNGSAGPDNYRRFTSYDIDPTKHQIRLTI